MPVRERFTRRCAAHLTHVFERAEGYRIPEGEDSQSRESGLWCPRQLPGGRSFGHWVTRWVVYDEEGDSAIATASLAPSVSTGEYVELDEGFFKGMLELLEEGSSVFDRLITSEDPVCPDDAITTEAASVHVVSVEVADVPKSYGARSAASVSMLDAHAAILRVAARSKLSEEEEEAMRVLSECTAIAWCPRERKKPFRPKSGYQLEICWQGAIAARADEWAELA